MEFNQEVVNKLNLLVKLNAASLASGKDFKEQVQLLSSVGLTPKEIGDILGKTPNNVSVTLNYIKKRKNEVSNRNG